MNMRSSAVTECDHLHFFCQKRKCINDINDFLLTITSFAKISFLDDLVVTSYQSEGGRPWEKVAQILITLTLHCDFHFKCSNISLSGQ